MIRRDILGSRGRQRAFQVLAGARFGSRSGEGVREKSCVWPVAPVRTSGLRGEVLGREVAAGASGPGLTFYAQPFPSVDEPGSGPVCHTTLIVPKSFN